MSCLEITVTRTNRSPWRRSRRAAAMQGPSNKSEQIMMEVLHNDKVGRYAVASWDFSPGDVVFSEAPFAFGPKADSPPLCLGCLAPVDCTTVCSRCKWPVCSKQCEEIPIHKNGECMVFSKAKVRFQPVENPSVPSMQYECIVPLRVLLAKQSNPERWESEVRVMESHNNARKTKPIWKFNQINIVSYLRGPCRLQDTFSEEVIHTVCGILESNTFEARSASGHAVRCLFPKLAIMSHNCISNISHSITCTGSGDADDFRVVVRAATKIRKGEELFSSYTYSLWPTLARREHLRESKYFDCCCARCADPTEMGTHMSTVKCHKCESGMVTSKDPLDVDSDWVCSNCENLLPASEIRQLYGSIQREIDAADNSPLAIRPKLLEMLLQKYEKKLHSQHAYCSILKSSLIQMYGLLSNECPNNLLRRKVECCEQLLSVLSIIEPGYSRIRGTTFYELYQGLSLMLMNQTQVENSELQITLQDMGEALEEASSILGLESETTPEGKLGIKAKKLLSQFRNDFQEIANSNLGINSMMDLDLDI